VKEPSAAAEVEIKATAMNTAANHEFVAATIGRLCLAKPSFPHTPLHPGAAPHVVAYGLTLWLRHRTSSAKTFLETGIALIGLKF